MAAYVTLVAAPAGGSETANHRAMPFVHLLVFTLRRAGRSLRFFSRLEEWEEVPTRASGQKSCIFAGTPALAAWWPTIRVPFRFVWVKITSRSTDGECQLDPLFSVVLSLSLHRLLEAS